MYSYRCSMCGAHWPPVLGEKCPLCKEPTTPSQAEPTPEWRELIAEHARVEPARDEFPTVTGELRKLGKKTWALRSTDVIRSGISSRLQEDTVLRVITEGGELFAEVLGYSYEGRLYIVRLFQTRWPSDSKGRSFVPKRWKLK